MKKLRVGITCVGSLIAQGIIKSIRKSDLSQDIEMIGFEYFPGMIGSYWVDQTYLMPDILKENISEEDYLGVLIKHILDQQIRFLFVGMDFELPMMSRNKKRILSETGCDIIVSPIEVIRIADDKYLTFEFLKQHDLPHPKTRLPDQADDIAFPVIVKPRIGERSRNVFVVRNEEELRDRLARVPRPVIQEVVGTQDEEYTCGVLFLGGEVKTKIFLRRYLRDGNTNLAFHSSKIPRPIQDYVAKISQKLQPYGPCNFQLRLGQDGVPKLFEINARFSGTTYMRTLFGLNEVAYLLYLLSGE
ncbi:MAG: ATP-grasp domain-containing protein, partial [Desulfobacteraceae bacterium]